MRLILSHSHLDTKTPPNLPDGTYFFVCFEDFSVGPVNDWNDRPKFDQQRADFWKTTQMLDLPDGSKMDYVVWMQGLPRYDLVELIQSGVSFEEMPKMYEFAELIHEATTIEIWHDLSVRGCVFRWYAVAALHGLGIQPERVSACVLPNLIRERQSAGFWSDMLLDNPGRAVLAAPISTADWDLALLYWAALTGMPNSVEKALVQRADKPSRDALAVLSARFPDPATGLTNIQERLLRSASHDWRKMARVVGDAMGTGWEEKDPIGDSVLHAELIEMARMNPPLLAIMGEGAMRYCRVRLTHFGETKRLSLGP